MAIKIKIEKAKEATVVQLEMDIRKSLNGDLMIFDHGDIDIVLSTANNKVVAFPKETMTDLVYGAQNRLFAHLRKKGIVIAESIQGGSFYGSIEATLETPFKESISSAKMALVNIDSFINEERPYFETMDHLEDMEEEHFTSPEEEDSTALGDVPHEDKKGAMITGLSVMHSPFYYNYYLQEDKER